MTGKLHTLQCYFPIAILAMFNLNGVQVVPFVSLRFDFTSIDGID